MNKYIYKSDALNGIAKLINENKRQLDTSFHRGKRAALIEALEEIEKIKGTDVQPLRHGVWQQDGTTHKRCSNCKAFLVPNLKASMFNYCPNCGARMDLGEEKT